MSTLTSKQTTVGYESITLNPIPTPKTEKEREVPLDRAKDYKATETSDSKVLGWVNQIIPAYGKQNASALEIGQILHQAKKDLRAAGLWTYFLKSEALPFSKRRAEMLLRIWHDLNDLDAQTFAHLPAGWSILYELTHLERGELIRFIESKVVHPKLTLAKSKELTGRLKLPKSKTAAEWVARVKDQAEERKEDWPVADHGLVANELMALAQSLQKRKATVE